MDTIRTFFLLQDERKSQSFSHVNSFLNISLEEVIGSHINTCSWRGKGKGMGMGSGQMVGVRAWAAGTVAYGVWE